MVAATGVPNGEAATAPKAGAAEVVAGAPKKALGLEVPKAGAAEVVVVVEGAPKALWLEVPKEGVGVGVGVVVVEGAPKVVVVVGELKTVEKPASNRFCVAALADSVIWMSFCLVSIDCNFTT